eukprot:Hpha_TRINITY_DN1208_c0_g1::TRINITY_DN1208_c0_g1_i1::g.44769::m.44769
MLPMVGVLVPTFKRGDMARDFVCSAFAMQSYPQHRRRLYVCRDGAATPEVAEGWTRGGARYTEWIGPRPPLGLKRQAMAVRAAGEGCSILVHWDDDDVYGREYLASAVQTLEGADVVKLLNFPLLQFHGSPQPPLVRSRNVAGWSLAYRSSVLRAGAAYAHTDWGEENAFVSSAMQRGLRVELAEWGVSALHMDLGSGASSRVHRRQPRLKLELPELDPGPVLLGPLQEQLLRYPDCRV